jgi:hypothetical protein
MKIQERAMKSSAKRMITAVGGVAIVAFLLTLAAPKAVQAVVSTLVTVANTTTNPVPTKAADNPARQAVVLTVFVGAGDGVFGASGPMISPETQAAYTVPAGQRLVVESVTGIAELGGGQTPFTVNITFDSNVIPLESEPPTIFLVPTFSGTASGTSAFSFASSVTTYVEPGSQLTAQFTRGPSNAGGAILLITLSGHLESIQ